MPFAYERLDTKLICVFFGLIMFGLVMVYSASNVWASIQYKQAERFLVRQALFAGMGLVMTCLVAFVKPIFLKKISNAALFASVGLLLLVLSPLGKTVGGSSRWIPLGFFNLQPAEFAKVALLLWFAKSMSEKREVIKTFKMGTLPHVMIAALLGSLCLVQPDFGSAVVLMVMCVMMLFMAGGNIWHLLGLVALVVPTAYALVVSSPYRMKRILAFQSPFEHRSDIGYQISESIIAFGSGGVGGQGLGDSRQKLFFLPEAHNDFISAIIGEEFGFIGMVFLISSFLFLGFRGFQLAARQPDPFLSILASGSTALIMTQAFTNLAVAMALLPTKGLVLPFISYGGSGMLANCLSMGLLLNATLQQSEGIHKDGMPHQGSGGAIKSMRAVVATT